MEEVKEELEVIDARPKTEELSLEEQKKQRRLMMLSRRQYHVHNSKNYREFTKVWRKYHGRNLRKNFGEDYIFVKYILFEEEINKYLSTKGYIGNQCRIFKEKMLGKKLAFDENPEHKATFVGLELTNNGLFYIVEYGDQKYQIHQSNLSFIL